MAEETRSLSQDIPMANSTVYSQALADPPPPPLPREVEDLLRQIDATRFLLARPQRGVR